MSLGGDGTLDDESCNDGKFTNPDECTVTRTYAPHLVFTSTEFLARFMPLVPRPRTFMAAGAGWSSALAFCAPRSVAL